MEQENHLRLVFEISGLLSGIGESFLRESQPPVGGSNPVLSIKWCGLATASHFGTPVLTQLVMLASIACQCVCVCVGINKKTPQHD